MKKLTLASEQARVLNFRGTPTIKAFPGQKAPTKMMLIVGKRVYWGKASEILLNRFQETLTTNRRAYEEIDFGLGRERVPIIQSFTFMEYDQIGCLYTLTGQCGGGINSWSLVQRDWRRCKRYFPNFTWATNTLSISSFQRILGLEPNKPRLVKTIVINDKKYVYYRYWKAIGAVTLTSIKANIQEALGL